MNNCTSLDHWALPSILGDQDSRALQGFFSPTNAKEMLVNGDKNGGLNGDGNGEGDGGGGDTG